MVLGTAKVMSYEDLETAREKRAEKDAAKEARGKGRRGRKCKSATPEADEATADKAKRGRAGVSEPPVTQMSGTTVAEDELVPKPWRAPEARMY